MRRERAEAADVRATPIAKVAELAPASAMAHMERRTRSMGLSLEVGLPTGVTRGLRAATPSCILVSAGDESMLSRIEEMLSSRAQSSSTDSQRKQVQLLVNVRQHCTPH